MHILDLYLFYLQGQSYSQCSTNGVKQPEVYDMYKFSPIRDSLSVKDVMNHLMASIHTHFQLQRTYHSIFNGSFPLQKINFEILVSIYNV